MTLVMVSILAVQAQQPAELLELGEVLLDDRLPAAERVSAAESLALIGDPGALWMLRAAVRDRLPEVQRAAVVAAMRFEGAEAVGVMAWVVADRKSDASERALALDLLVDHGSDDAGEALWELAADRRVPARLRGDARQALALHWPQLVEARGGPRTVVDPLGGAAFVAGSGVLGGVALSSVGVWGRFDAAPAIGGVGGAAVGLGTGALYVANQPLTPGQGLAWASGISWGLTASAWTTSAAHGPWTWIRGARRETAVELGALYRLVGVAGGAVAGGLWMRSDPRAWDVLEVDAAGYLGSAVVLAGVGLVVWPAEPEPFGGYETTYAVPPGGRSGGQAAYRSWEADNRRAAQVLAGSSVLGAAGGLAAGWALKDAWDLDLADGLFATTLGLEAAWIGDWTPDALGIDDTHLKGTVRLPWHAAIIGGLALAEVHPMPLQTTAVTATSMVATNEIGAGLPLLAGHEDAQSVAQVMVPVGALGTTAGLLAAPWLDPGPSDWVMTGIGSVIAASQAGLIGGYLLERETFTEMSQMAGLVLVGQGLATSGLLVAGHYAEPRIGDALVVGTAAGWGGFYGVLTPIGLRLEGPPEGVLLSAAVTSDAFWIGSALALSQGLEPRDTVLPQLGGVAGATVGSLTAALASAREEDAALGAVIGSTAGLVGGAVVTALTEDAGALALDLPRVGATRATVLPHAAPLPEPDGSVGIQVGVTVADW